MKSMKSVISLLTLSAFVVLAAAAWAQGNAAAGPNACAGKAQCGKGANYVDADGDGICDNKGTGKGANYVDADGDGVCDNKAQNCPGKGKRGNRAGACRSGQAARG